MTACDAITRLGPVFAELPALIEKLAINADCSVEVTFGVSPDITEIIWGRQSWTSSVRFRRSVDAETGPIDWIRPTAEQPSR
jgi:hypothetical protein